MTMLYYVNILFVLTLVATIAFTLVRWLGDVMRLNHFFYRSSIVLIFCCITISFVEIATVLVMYYQGINDKDTYIVMPLIFLIVIGIIILNNPSDFGRYAISMSLDILYISILIGGLLFLKHTVGVLSLFFV